MCCYPAILSVKQLYLFSYNTLAIIRKDQMMKYFFLLILIPLISISCNEKANNEIIKSQAIQLANEWTEAWNGTISVENMMALHHPELQYYWRDEPITYNGFKDVLEKYIIGKENYNLALVNPIVTVIDKNNVVVGFQLIDKGEDSDSAEGAFTIVITRHKSKWKIIHIHES